MNPLQLAGLFELSDEQFRRRFRDTPLWRARRRGLLRNAAIVLGNCPAPAALPGLLLGLDDPEPLVRGACAWAVGQADHSSARGALAARNSMESDMAVRAEIAASLARFA
jgi:epoxyqueuosine reductase